ncbi:MAG: ABC transporter substrate-binding protein [Lachnospiraceae bacterium]|nr:ABC transporter substrate-binding protein [Lachnospiraceae bacterium]
MQRMRAVLGGLLLFIWIMSAAGCTGPKPEQTVNSEESQYCWATVILEGGSGKASVESPCPVLERSGELLAVITWSSSHYDFMVIDGEKILPVNKEGNSQFEIPLKSAVGSTGTSQSETLPEDCEMQVQSDTTAMSTPHLVDYTLSFRFFKTKEEAESAGEPQQEEDSTGATQEEAVTTADIGEAPELSGLQYLSKDENEYAQSFAIYRYENEYTVLAIDDGRSYLIIPEGAEIPEETTEDLIILRRPLNRIYLAASAVMCQFDEIGAVDNVILSGLEKDGWYIEAAREAMEKGTLEYGGKYSAPDYERIVASGVNLAVESTMIHHTPKVQEKLEKLGIPVLIDRSSYESEPLGRAEWVKAYGLLTGREEEAAQAFEEQKSYVEALRGNTEADAASTSGSDSAAPQKTVAIFSINSTRQVVTRGAGDYFGKMVEIAGGTLSTPATDAGRATQTVSMESFYAAAEQADILIYNASIEDAPEDLQQMCAKDSILTQFRAVREGNVWCMRSSLYQNASRTGAIIRDLHAIVAGEADEETEFFYRLK